LHVPEFFTEADAELARRIGLADLHSDIPLGLLRRRFDEVEGALRDEWVPKLRAGGVQMVNCAVYVDSIYLPEGALRRAVQTVDALLEEIELCRDEVELARSAGDVERITGEGKIAVLLSFEGAEPLGMDLSGLRLFHKLGLRMLSFAWMRRTAFGDGTWENDSRGGLTRLGKAAVEEMNRLGIIVDVSHASDRTTWDVLETSTAPVIASHSNARTLHDHPRNVTDEMIRAIAESGGLVGVVAVAGFIATREATIARWVDHVDHIVQLVGIEHVGVGCDFYKVLMEMGASQEIPAWRPPGGMPPLAFTGMEDYPDLPGLAAELVRRGYGEGDLRKIYRENFMRVLGAVAG
jgi:membrane dipeptidase